MSRQKVAARAEPILQQSGNFTPLIEGKKSISEKYARLRARFRGKTPGAPD
jgi:hypothetical protein